MLLKIILLILLCINVIIEFDNWMTLNTLCNIGQSTLRGIGCQLLKKVHDFNHSQLTCVMTPVVGKRSCGKH